jgi:hypothetical protein
MKRSLLVLALVACVLGAAAAGVARPVSNREVSAESQAKAVASRFMRTLNAKRFEQVCHMMAARFYRENNVPSQARCVLGLRIGFMGAETIRFRIVGVEVDGKQAVVRAVADGAPGRIVLVEEDHRFKVLSLQGA